MKNFYVYLLQLSILFLPILTQAQWNLNGTNVYYNDGNVGIGTSTPETQLEIEGRGNQTIRIHSTGFGADDPGIELIRGGEFDGTDWKMVNDGGRLKFKSTLNNFTTAGNTYFLLGATGNATMKSSASNHFIKLNGSGNQTIRLHSEGFGAKDASIELLRGGEFDGSDYKITNDGGVFKIMTALNNFSDSGSEALRITQSRNVAIGNNGSAAKLHIKGSDSHNNVGNNGITSLRIQSGSQNLYMDGNEIDGSNHIYLNHNLNKNVYMGTGGGSVGIGTTSPGNYKLAVNGKVKCKEVKVTNSGWADFVFEPEYQLLELEKLEKYIQHNKKLPGIPSQSEVLAEGINLGEIDALLLQKIEELTLYVIELKKENERLAQLISIIK